MMNSLLVIRMLIAKLSNCGKFSDVIYSLPKVMTNGIVKTIVSNEIIRSQSQLTIYVNCPQFND